jgi:hypothetical protein
MADARENLVRVARALQRVGILDTLFVGGATGHTAAVLERLRRIADG